MIAFRAIMDHVVPGHWETVRPPNDVELRQTLVTAVGLDEVSAKVRVGPPDDEVGDVGLPIWAGQIPLRHGRGRADRRCRGPGRRPDARLRLWLRARVRNRAASIG